MNCPFCNKKDIQEIIILKNNLVKAFPTNIPITPGHTLVCPTKHVTKIDELSDEETVEIVNFLVRIKEALKQALNAKGFNVAWNEGGVAGQSVSHLHIHIVPRKDGDTGIYEYEPRKFLYRPGGRAESPEQELKGIAELIKKNLK